MKTSLALLLTSLLLVFSLTACGKDQQPSDATNGGSVTDNNDAAGGNNSPVTGSDSSAPSSGGLTGGDTSADSGTANNSLTDDVGDAARDMGNAARDMGDAITGRTADRTRSGYSYNQMVRNGRVF